MSPSTEVDVLLVGGGVASVRCARSLRRAGFDGSILLVGEERVAPYNRPPLSKELLRDALPDELVHAEPEGWYGRRSIELRTATRVVAIEPGRARATLGDGREIRFGRCLVATGAAPRIPPIPGIDAAHPLRTLEDARRIERAARELPAGSPVAIIGGGLIGIEVASSLASVGLRPTILERAGALWGGSLGVELDAWARRQLDEQGVAARTESTVEAVEPGAVRVGGRALTAALVVVGVGVAPRVELAEAAGLAIEDGILTDAAHRTDHPAVWAAGDVARVAGRRVEHWHAAREGGERAARSMLGLELEPPPPPWTFTEVAGRSVDVVGEAEGWDAERWLEPDRLLVHERDGRAARIVSIDGAADPTALRALVASRAGVDEARILLRRP